MAFIALTSAKGSPGVTTTALALATCWQGEGQVLLVEADPAGGDVLPGYFGGQLVADRGVRQLSLGSRRAPLEHELWSQVYPLQDGNRALLVPGIVDPVEAAAIAWDPLAEHLYGLSVDTGLDVLVDCGRLGNVVDPAAMRRRADLVVLVVRPTLAGVNVAKFRGRQLMADLRDRGAGPEALCVVVCGPGPYTAGEIGGALGIPVAGQVADDAPSAAVLSSGAVARRSFPHSALVRSAQSLAVTLKSSADQRRATLTVARRDGQRPGQAPFPMGETGASYAR